MLEPRFEVRVSKFTSDAQINIHICEYLRLIYNKNSFMLGLSNILNIENLLNKNIFLILCVSIKS